MQVEAQVVRAPTPVRHSSRTDSSPPTAVNDTSSTTVVTAVTARLNSDVLAGARAGTVPSVHSVVVAVMHVAGAPREAVGEALGPVPRMLDDDGAGEGLRPRRSRWDPPRRGS